MAPARLIGIYILLFYLKNIQCQQNLEIQNIGLHVVPNMQGGPQVQVQNNPGAMGPSNAQQQSIQQAKFQQQQAWQQQQALQQQQAIQQQQVLQQQVLQQQAIQQQQASKQQQGLNQQQAQQEREALLQQQHALKQQQAWQEQQQALQQQQAVQQQQALQQQFLQQQQLVLQQQQQQALQQQQQHALQQQQAVQQPQALQQQAIQQNQALQQQQAFQQQQAMQQQQMIQQQVLQQQTFQQPMATNFAFQGSKPDINIASLPNVKLSTSQANSAAASSANNIPTIQLTSLKFVPVEQKSAAMMQSPGTLNAPTLKNTASFLPSQAETHSIAANVMNLQQSQQMIPNIPVPSCAKSHAPVNLPSINFNTLQSHPSFNPPGLPPVQNHLPQPSPFLLQNQPSLASVQSQLNSIRSPPMIPTINQQAIDSLQNNLAQSLPKTPSLATPPRIPMSSCLQSQIGAMNAQSRLNPIQNQMTLPTIQNQVTLPSIQNPPINSISANPGLMPLQNQQLFSSIQSQQLNVPAQFQPALNQAFNPTPIAVQSQPLLTPTNNFQPTVPLQTPTTFTPVQNQQIFLPAQSQAMNMQSQSILAPISNQVAISPAPIQSTIITNQNQLPSSMQSQPIVLPQTQTLAIQNQPTSSIQFQPLITPQNQFVPIQNQPVISIQTQSMPSTAVSSIQSVPVTLTPNQPTVIPVQSPAYSIILPPVQTESAQPYLAVPPVMPEPPAKPTKSSSLKSLIPLLINILKERNCGCHNCNCIKNIEPTVYGGYSNQKNYGPLPSESSIMPGTGIDHGELFRPSRSDNVSDQKMVVKNFVDDEDSSEDSEEDSEYVDDEENEE